MKTLVEDLRAYIALDRHSGARAHVSLDALAAEVVAEQGDTIRRLSADVEIGRLPQVFGSRWLLSLLLGHLLSNALKFVPEGVPPRIRITAASAPEGWDISVEDNGIGIAPRHQGVVFDLFRRLHPRERYEGTGIGLSVCRRVAELHGGRLRLESTPGLGSRFVLSIPTVDSAAT